MILRLTLVFFILASFLSNAQSVFAKPFDKVSSVKLQNFTKLYSDWTLQGDRLVANFKFTGGFKGAVEFVQQLVKPADAMNHHPDLSISYNKVTVSLTTHDAGGITEADLQLAETIQNLYTKVKK